MNFLPNKSTSANMTLSALRTTPLYSRDLDNNGSSSGLYSKNFLILFFFVGDDPDSDVIREDGLFRLEDDLIVPTLLLLLASPLTVAETSV